MGAAVVIDPKIHQNVQRLLNHLSRKELKKLAKEPAKVVVKAAKNLVPVGNKPHKRYSNGKVVATYYPGNLRRSIGIVNLKDSNIVWVGPKLAKGNTSGEFRGNKVDGYYGHMVEYGLAQDSKPYMRPAYENTKAEVRNLLTKEMESHFDKFKPV